MRLGRTQDCSANSHPKEHMNNSLMFCFTFLETHTNLVCTCITLTFHIFAYSLLLLSLDQPSMTIAGFNIAASNARDCLKF